MKKLLLTVFIISNLSFSQKQIVDTLQGTPQNLNEVIVKALRVKFSSPITFSNVKRQQYEKRNLGQDLPILLKYLPSVVTTSDAGAGVGYTGIRVRGVSPQSTNITINGIPFNDAESHGTYWVNLPDFSSSVESLQLQRGVGTSTNGSGAFGASINILTDSFSENSFTEISSSIGSYNTQKNTVKFSTGLINDHFELSGRLSKIKSDGYVDRAFSDLKSYFLQGTYYKGSTLIKALAFGGHERTYQSWYGLTSDQLLENRRQNPYTYENEIDNYKQDHFQLHWNEIIDDNWSTNLSLNYTDGRGYFEQYREDDSVDTYDGIVGSDLDSNGNILGTTDIIRRRWLDNDFYVLNFSTNYKSDNLDFIFNGSFSDYDGDHFGEVIWARTFSLDGKIRDRYYDGIGKKTDLSFFTKVIYSINNFELFGDLQFRNVKYTTSGTTSDLVEMLLNKKHNFFNPKLGVSYKLNSNSILYSSYSRANREPNRTDYENNNNVKPEQLDDFEIGWRYRNENITLNVNSYLMIYNDQLVLTGALDDVGNPIRNNSGSSHRFGLEIESFYSVNNLFDLNTSLSFSSNKNKSYISNFNGQLVDFGNTNISFSPDFVASNALIYTIDDNSSLSLLSKYVGKQYMSNTDSEFSLLNSYFVNDLNFSHSLDNTYVFDSITFSLLINNLFNVEYISNGYYYTYDDTWSDPNRVTTIEGTGYYPQATRNFLAGIQLRF
jgi:iron complex outermembrane receptor protein